MYAPMHEAWAPAMGIRGGAPGPHVTLGVGYDEIVVVVEASYPEEIGWHPWFDQPDGQTMEIPGRARSNRNTCTSSILPGSPEGRSMGLASRARCPLLRSEVVPWGA